jgi:hypothetical protein
MEIPEAGDPLYFLLPLMDPIGDQAVKAGRIRNVYCRNEDGTFTVDRTQLYGSVGHGTWVVRRFPQGDRFSKYASKRSWIASLGDGSLLTEPVYEGSSSSKGAQGGR